MARTGSSAGEVVFGALQRVGSSVGCFRPGECIFSGYVCDGEVDCSNAADEPPLATCENHEQEFTKVTGEQ